MNRSPGRQRARPKETVPATKVTLKTEPGGKTPAAEHACIEPDPELARLAADRVVVENVSPEIDCGRFAAKAAVGDSFIVEADIFSDGHDKIDAALLIRRADQERWREAPMAFVDNDRWRGFATVEENARYIYTIIAW